MNKKPLLLFLVGVEGSGHHLTRAFLKSFFIKERVAWFDKAMPFMFYRWDALQEGMNKQSPSLVSKSDYLNAIGNVVKNNPEMNFMYLSASFPYGLRRDTLRRPDILDMVELLAPYFEIRPMVIYRDPVSCAYSAVRRGFNKNALHQARIVEDNLLFIKQQIETSNMDYQSVSYERFITDPDVYQTVFQEWWDVDVDSFEQGKKEIRQPTQKKSKPKEIINVLEEFFTPLRVKQWDSFLQAKDIAC